MTKRHELIALIDCCPNGAVSPPGVSFIPSGRFTAVFGKSTSWRMPMSGNRRQALQGAAERQAHLESCMRFGTVLPVRRECFVDPDAMSVLLTANADILDQVSQRLRGAVQYQVTVRWQAAQVLMHFRDTPEIRPLFSGTQITPVALESAVGKLAARLEATMWPELRSVGREVLALPVAEDVLLNAAVLVSEADIFNLDQAVERIDAIWPEGLSIRQIGPAPGSSFALLDPVWKDAATIEHAHVTLRLNPGASDQEITEARRTSLMKPGCDPGHIRLAAQLVQAATRLGGVKAGLHLCAIRADDQSTSASMGLAVA
ncbi:GvpL/GvpF family gas vesicle protein [Sulfitobacter sp. JB4-11]|uniref:GvpL/GvpF family gas vesicle protein n=1 Tax=Sulfitobacter rhodophyticola TaxID=3238304 RepID=UPI0035171A51